MTSYFGAAIGVHGNTISSVSEKYEHLFTPAGYAFSIWGLIFLSLIIYVFFQVNRVFISFKSAAFVKDTGPWFIIANLANVAWVISWLNENLLLSVVFMFIILSSLVKVIINTNMEKWDAPFKIIAFTWWPICLYAGWISVASIANVSSWLTKIGRDGWGLTQVQWTIIVIAVAVLVNAYMIYRRNMREFALVGVWALVAIFVRHTGELPSIAYTALAGAVILFLYISWHGFKNRKSNPMYKLVVSR
jgi:hypothetical protein